MTQVIVYTSSDGNVHVCAPTGEISIEEVQAKDTPAGSVIIDSSTLPDTYFFGAWELSGSTVSVSMDKAKAITKARLRAEREPLFAAQDIAYQRALESNTDTVAIVAEKQRLRDITLLADAATTLDELKAITP